MKWKVSIIEFLSYFQANNLAHYCFMDDSGRHKTLRSHIKDFMTHGIASRMVISRMIAQDFAKSHGDEWVRRLYMYSQSGSCITKNNYEVRKHKSFYKGP